MLSKIDQREDADKVEKGLGVGIRFAVTVGQGRQIEMTAGVPLDWSGDDFNLILDKLGGCMDRQAWRYQLHDMKLALEQAEQQLRTNARQLDLYESQCQTEWSQRNKQGELRLSESQLKQVGNFKNTDQHLKQQIEKLRKDIKDVEEKCR